MSKIKITQHLLYRAIKFAQKKKFNDARNIFKKIIFSEPRNVQALHNLGKVELVTGNFQLSEEYLAKALALSSGSLEIRKSLLEVYLKLKNKEKAAQLIEQSRLLGINFSELPEVKNKLERLHDDMHAPEESIHKLLALYNQGEYEVLLKESTALVAEFPNTGMAWKMLGAAQDNLNQGQFALASLYQASKLLPEDHEIWFGLGVVAQSLNLLPVAEEAFEKAHLLKPAWPEARGSLATIYLKKEQTSLARKLIDEGLELQPDEPFLTSLLASTLARQGRLDLSSRIQRRQLEVVKDDPFSFTSYLFNLTHDADVTPKQLAIEHKRFGKRFEAPLLPLQKKHTNNPDPDRVINIGFVSGDLFSHAVAYYLIARLKGVKKADNAKCRLWAYYSHTKVDRVTEELKNYFDQWHQVAHLSDDELADQIRQDKIDVLIDLSGHTDRNRLLVFARKPAPIQFTDIGYPFTTGLKSMDYRFMSTDYKSQDGFKDLWTENFIWLSPASNIVLNRPHKRPEAPCHLFPSPFKENGYVTFGSFNRLSKINPQTIKAWADILRQVPRSYLVLGNVSDVLTRNSLAQNFVDHGVDANRLIFISRVGVAAYLKLYKQIDLLLDAWPYAGSTTTKDSLSMAVPVLTLEGLLPMQNASASLLRRMGMNELVATEVEEYIHKAIDLGCHPEKLQDLRERLMAMPDAGEVSEQSSAPKTPAFIRAVREAWRRWCAGLPAESFDLPND